MKDLTTGRRDGHMKGAAIFATRAIALLLEGGVLRNAAHGTHALKQLSALLDDWEQSNPAPRHGVEQADIEFVRTRLQI